MVFTLHAITYLYLTYGLYLTCDYISLPYIFYMRVIAVFHYISLPYMPFLPFVPDKITHIFYINVLEGAGCIIIFLELGCGMSAVMVTMGGDLQHM